MVPKISSCVQVQATIALIPTILETNFEGSVDLIELYKKNHKELNEFWLRLKSGLIFLSSSMVYEILFTESIFLFFGLNTLVQAPSKLNPFRFAKIDLQKYVIHQN